MLAVMATRLQPARPARRRHQVTTAAGPSATARLFKLHELLAAKQPVNAVSLAEEFEMAPRTIKRDIEFLRDRRGAPIRWNASSKSYYYTEPFDLASGLRLDAEEALAVILAGNTFAAWGGTPLGRTLTAALEKIASFAGPALSFPAADLRAVLHQDDASLLEPEHRHFAALLEHILARREITIRYQKPHSSRPGRRTVRPLHLAYLDHRWMLIAEDTAKRAWRNFLLPRIQSIDTSHRRFTPPPPEKIKSHLAGSLGRFTGDEEIEVRLRFNATAAPYVRERPWHATQTLVERPDGGVEATLRLNNLKDVQRRILANGRHVEVLAPAELRAALAAEIAAMSRAYAPPPAEVGLNVSSIIPPSPVPDSPRQGPVGLSVSSISVAPAPPAEKIPVKIPAGHPVSPRAR